MTTTEPTDALGVGIRTSERIELTTPEDRLIAALGDEPAPSDDESPEEHEQAVSAWREQWAVQDLADADWAGRKLRQVEARLGAIDALAARQLAQIKEWQEAERRKHAADLAYFTGRLEAFHRVARADDPKHNKTVTLPCGVSLNSKAGGLSLVVTDPAAATAWLEDNCSAALEYPPAKIAAVEVKRRFSGKASAETEPGAYPAITENGEVVPGFEIVRADTSYWIS